MFRPYQGGWRASRWHAPPSSFRSVNTTAPIAYISPRTARHRADATVAQGALDALNRADCFLPPCPVLSSRAPSAGGHLSGSDPSGVISRARCNCRLPVRLLVK